MDKKLDFTATDNVAVITLDDGKVNACGFEMLEAINGALDRAEQECSAVALLGRGGILSGGFDLKVIRGGDEDELKRLVTLGVRTMMRLYGHPQPLVVGATGHAVALGAFMLLTGDYRYGVAGDFRIGLNETAIGLDLPQFGIELAQARLSPRFLSEAAICAELYSPLDAIEVGFLDEVAAPDHVREAAIERARAMLELDGRAFAANKRAFRGAAIDRVMSALAA